MPFYHPNSSSQIGSIDNDGPFWSFDDVQERLVEAWWFLSRLPDRDARFLRTKTMGLWDSVSVTFGMTAVEQAEYRLYREADPPRMPPLSRDQVGRMTEALGWLEWIENGETRRIIYRAVRELHSGRATRIKWGDMASDPTLPGSADRLRMAYNRSITLICNRLNTAFEPR
jgi:hypothetical protein